MFLDWISQVQNWKRICFLTRVHKNRLYILLIIKGVPLTSQLVVHNNLCWVYYILKQNH